MDQPQQNPQNNMTSPAHLNWLYIAIVVFLLLVLGGGVWWYVSSKTPLQEQKKETASQDQTASWKTYRNEDFSFTLKIPPEWSNYVVDKEVRPAGSEFVYGSGKKSQFPWVIYNLGIKGSDLGSTYYPDQTYNLITIIVFEISDAKKLDIQSEVKNTFTVYKFVPTATKYFVLYKGSCQDCADGEPFTKLRKGTDEVIETFRAE